MGNDVPTNTKYEVVMGLLVPVKFLLKLKDFAGDNKTGNITLHIREGEILGWKFEELEQNN